MSRGTYVNPFPKKPEEQAKLPFLGYRNMIEKVAERYHTTPDTLIALNGRGADRHRPDAAPAQCHADVARLCPAVQGTTRTA